MRSSFCVAARVWRLAGAGDAHGSTQTHSGLWNAVFAWHDAPQRSPACEITFIQPSHAWMNCFGCKKRAKQGLVGRVSGGKNKRWGLIADTVLVFASAAEPFSHWGFVYTAAESLVRGEYPSIHFLNSLYMSLVWRGGCDGAWARRAQGKGWEYTLVTGRQSIIEKAQRSLSHLECPINWNTRVFRHARKEHAHSKALDAGPSCR